MGISERQFYRRLVAKDPEALALQRQDLLQAFDDELRTVAVDLGAFATKFQRCDKKLAGALHRACCAVYAALDMAEPDREAIDDALAGLGR